MCIRDRYAVEVVEGDGVRLVDVVPGDRFGTFVEIDGDIDESETVIAP